MDGLRDGAEGGSDNGGGAVGDLIAAAVRPVVLDTAAQARAVAAFRAVREGGAAGTRTRRRDDWRARGVRRAGRALRTTSAVLLVVGVAGVAGVVALVAEEGRRRAGAG
ncbi:hypothetical protein OK074_4878 [Actinobacteria bacterium OK074]|nr:hypothetical protein OK074_4878 [Actinobacteria bacterium OK074]